MEDHDPGVRTASIAEKRPRHDHCGGLGPTQIQDSAGGGATFSRLPMAMPKQKGTLFYLKTSRLRRLNLEFAWDQGRRNGHGVAVFQQWMRFELRDHDPPSQKSFPVEDSRPEAS